MKDLTMGELENIMLKFAMLPNYWDLAHDLGMDTTSIDSAIPQPWADKLRKDMGMQPHGIAWSYEDPNSRIFGTPINFALKVLVILSEAFQKAHLKELQENEVANG